MLGNMYNTEAEEEANSFLSFYHKLKEPIVVFDVHS
jgi:hypothetical protein